MKLRDIAKAAGVSLTAVSLVLNGKPGVGEEKRARIRALLRENGYALGPEEAAPEPVRNICFLKYSRHAYLVNGNPGFVTQIIDAADKECRRHGYNLLITAFNDFDAIDLSALLENPSTAGIILLGTELENEDMVRFSGVSKPLVVVDNPLWGLPFSSVTMHNWDSIGAVVEHLRSLGHREIGFLYNAIPSSNDRERRAAFEDSLRLAGLPFSEDRIYSIFPTMDGARKSTLELLDSGVRFPPALVANNDSIAIGVLQALRERGIRVPEDISLTGFDGLPFAAVSDPPLTTVSVSCADIGYWAVHILHEKIHGRTAVPCRIFVCTSLLLRGSTGPPPRSEGPRTTRKER